MTDGVVAANTGEIGTFFFRARMRAVLDRLDDLAVTLVTRFFGDLAVVLLDPKGIRKVAGRECEGMPKAIRGLRSVLTDDVRRSVAVVAGGNGPMTRLDVACVVLLHDMAVGAGFGIVGHVGATFRIDKGVGSEANSKSGKDNQEDQTGAASGVHEGSGVFGIATESDDDAKILVAGSLVRKPGREAQREGLNSERV